MPEARGFSILRCGACGALDPGPRQRCPSCGSAELGAVAPEGSGTLVSWTVIRRPPVAFADEGPYAVALVDLVEGVRIAGQLAYLDSAPPLGAEVRIVDVADGVPIFAAA